MKRIYKISLISTIAILSLVIFPGTKSAQAACSYGYTASPLSYGYASDGYIDSTYGLSLAAISSNQLGLPNQNPPSLLQVINFAYPTGAADCFPPDFVVNQRNTTWDSQKSIVERITTSDRNVDIIDTIENGGRIGRSGDTRTYYGLGSVDVGSDNSDSGYLSTSTSIQREDSLVNSIANNGGFTINFIATSTSQPTVTHQASAFVQATNCAILNAGTGGNKNIVFLRDNSWDNTLEDFGWTIKDSQLKIMEAERVAYNYSYTSYYGNPSLQHLHFFADLKKWQGGTSTTSFAGLSSKSSCPGKAVYVVFSKSAYPNSFAALDSYGNPTGVRAAVFSNDEAVTMGGFMTGLLPFGGIFSWVDGVFSSSTNTHVPFSYHSAANRANELRKNIEVNLAAGHPVVVVSHSLGSFITFNVHNEYVGNNKVQFVYVDPPYNAGTINQILGNFVGVFNRTFGSVSAAINGGISTNPNTVSWTNGTGAPFKNHDAFDSPTDTSLAANGKTNTQNLEALKEKILLASIVVDDNFATTGSSPTADSLTSAPSINGFVDSLGSPVTSITPGGTVTIKGSFVAGNGYDINIQSTSNDNVYYNLYDYTPSTDGRTITFTLPTSYYLASAIGGPATIAGQYAVSVASVSSDLSNVVGIAISTTVSSNPNSIVPDPTVPNKFILTWASLASTGNMVGLTPVSLTGQPTNNSSNTASVWDSVKNFFKLIFGLNKASAQISTGTAMYQFSNLSSTNGSVTFTVPSSIPAGVYSVSVAIPGSNWVNTNLRINVITTTTVTVGGTSTTTVGTTVSSTTGAYTNGATVSATFSYICPFGWGIVPGAATPTCWGTSLLTPNPSTLGGSGSMSITITIPGSGGAIPASALKIPAAPILNCPTVPTGINGVFVRNGSVCTFSTTATSMPGTFTGYYCPGAAKLSTTIAGRCTPAPQACTGPGQTSSCSNPTPFLATFTYSCPTGYSLSGSTCNLGAGTTTTPVFTVTHTPTASDPNQITTTAGITYTCPTYFALAGTACISSLNGSTQAATPNYFCGAGYTLSGTSCISNPGITFCNGSPKSPKTQTIGVSGCVINQCYSPTVINYDIPTRTYSCVVPSTLVATSTGVTVSTTTITSTTTQLEQVTPNISSYICPSGLTLSITTLGNNCLSTATATQTYTCPSGSTLSGTSCIGYTVITVNATAKYVVGSFISNKPAYYTYTCPNGYTLNSTTHICSGYTTTTTAATANNTCPSGYTWDHLVPVTMCYKITSAATPNYTCPSGYTLNSSGDVPMCTRVVSTNNSASSTANVWDAIVSWLGVILNF